ncbi:MAG: HIT family protein [Arcobacter sp.]|nr:MAG: HIT family protein [Arcobacter sp.]
MKFLDNIIYQNELVKIEIEKSEIPWLKIFTIKDIKEFSYCDTQTKNEIWRCLDIIEKEMLEYFEPQKINIASFGNYCPHVHFHIQARFKEDSYFPESTWGKKQRESKLQLKDFNNFYDNLVLKLT